MFKPQKAFTLIELMVTICVLGTIIAIAIPNFNKQIRNSRSVALSEELITQLNLARYEAVRRANRVTVCASSNGTTCTGSWTDGYIVFVDRATSDTAAAPDLGTPPEILKVVGKAYENAVIDVKRGATPVTFIRYTALGSLGRVAAGSVEINSKIEGCTRGAPKARTITIGVSGLISVQKTNC